MIKKIPSLIRRSIRIWLSNLCLRYLKHVSIQLGIECEHMRDATKEEQDGINSYVKSISKPTGINFYDLL